MNRRVAVDKRPAFRRAVFGARLPDSVKVLLLRLLEDMNEKLIVSVPRNKLAEDLGVAPARVSERVKVAREKGYLQQVCRGRPGVTAVYQGVPIRGTESVPLEVRPPVPSWATDSVPLEIGDHAGIQAVEVRPRPTQVVETAATDDTVRAHHPGDVSGDEESGAPLALPYWLREPPNDLDDEPGPCSSLPILRKENAR